MVFSMPGSRQAVNPGRCGSAPGGREAPRDASVDVPFLLHRGHFLQHRLLEIESLKGDSPVWMKRKRG